MINWQAVKQVAPFYLWVLWDIIKTFGACIALATALWLSVWAVTTVF